MPSDNILQTREILDAARKRSWLLLKRRGVSSRNVRKLRDLLGHISNELEHERNKLCRVSRNGLHNDIFHDLETKKEKEEKLSLSFYGPCSLLPIIDYAVSHGHKVQHINMGVDDSRQTHFTPPLDEVDHEHSEANIVGLPLRSVMAAGASFFEGGENNEIFWPRITEIEGQERYFNECKKYISDFLESMSDIMGHKPTFFLSFWEPRENFRGALFPRYDLMNPQYFVEQLNVELERYIRNFPNTFLIDVNDILNSMGRFRIQDDYVREISHASNIFDTGFEDDQKRLQDSMPPSHLYDVDGQPDVFGHCVFNSIKFRLDVIKNIQPIKIIIMDLDDSLWRGVLADSDRTPFERTDYWPTGLAEALLVYKARGGLLAICSKNDHDLAIQEFDRVWNGRLKLNDFVSVKINYAPKSENIQEILEEVNLLPGNALFVDDNPREIDEVRSVFPDIRVLSKEHYDWRRAILLSPSTQVLHVSKESRQRTQNLQAKIDRDRSQKKMDRGAWLRSLEIQQRYAIISSETDDNFARAFELLNKTNQFNTTGKRWTHQEMGEFFAKGGYVFSVFLRDKTTDNGLIGLYLVEGNRIMQVILSCRVFGLESEYASMSILTQHILKKYSHVEAVYQPTGRNFYCEKYFEKSGFVQDGDKFVIKQITRHPETLKSEPLK